MDTGDQERRFKLSESQAAHVQSLKASLDSPDTDLRHRTILHASYALFAHTLGTTREEEHPLIAFVMLSNLKPGNIFAAPEDIPPFVNKITYMIRGLLFLKTIENSQSNPLTSLFDHLAPEIQWVSEITCHNVFTWLRQMMHLSATAAFKTSRPCRFYWSRHDGSSFTYDGDPIRRSDIDTLVQDAIQDVHTEWHALQALFQLPSTLFTTHAEWRTVCDSHASRQPNYSVFNDHRNTSLLQRTQAAIDHMADSGTFCKAADNTIVWYPEAIRKVHNRVKSFLIALGYAMYLTGGQPPRGSELFSTLWKNTEGRTRNIFAHSGSTLNVGLLNKTSFATTQDKLIPRAYPASLSLIIANYLTLIRPLEHIMAINSPKVDPDMAAMALNHLFIVGNLQLGTPHLSQRLEDKTQEILGIQDGWTTRDMRQVLTYIGMRFIAPHIKELNDGATVYLQAGHCVDVAKRWYGIEFERLSNIMSPDMMEEFLYTSFYHHLEFGVAGPEDRDIFPPVRRQPTAIPHRLTHPPQRSQQPPQLPPPVAAPSIPPASLHTPGTPSLSIDPDTLQAALNTAVQAAIDRLLPDLVAQVSHTPRAPPGYPQRSFTVPVSSKAYRILQTMMPGASFKSVEQAQSVELSLRAQHRILSILPTGGGKSLVWQLPVIAERGEPTVTIVFAPLLSLLDDIGSKLQALNISYHRFISNNPIPDHIQVLVAGYESAKNAQLWHWMKLMAGNHLIRRIVLDEIHTLITAGEFRPNMLEVGRLSSLKAPLILLTATLPPSLVPTLMQLAGLDISSVVEVRARTSRLNMLYTLTQLQKEKQETDAQRLWRWMTSLDGRRPGRRGLIYCQSKKLIDEVVALGSSLNHPIAAYHADLKEDVLSQSLLLWVPREDGAQIVWMLATSAYSLGIDKDDVDVVVHWECPRSWMDFSQESGRAGRGSRTGESIICFTRIPPIPEEDVGGRTALIDSLSSQICRRQLMDSYFDAEGASCLAYPAGTVLCCVCHDALEVQEGRRSAPRILYQPPPPATDSEIANANVPKHEQELLQTLKDWDNSCMICYMHGLGSRLHQPDDPTLWHGHTGCTLMGTVQEWEPDKLRWKRKFRQQITAIRTHYCVFCFLPQSLIYHSHLKPNSPSACLFPDHVPDMLWLITRLPFWNTWMSEVAIGLTQDGRPIVLEGEDDYNTVFLQVSAFTRIFRYMGFPASVKQAIAKSDVHRA